MKEGFSGFLRIMTSNHQVSQNESSAMKRAIIINSLIVLLLTAILTAGAVLMVGPQIMIIVPAAIVTGVVLAVRRSFLSLVCFGYPFTFGIVSALIGCAEIDQYAGTTAFAVSIGIGVLGVALMATGLWKALGARTTAIASGGAEQGGGGQAACPEST